MDRLSHLPDELLLRILSFLPTTKDVVPTMVLSKRWKFLWMFVPKLVYDDSYQSPEYARFSRFVDRSLFMHDAPVVETLHFTLGQICGAGDIQVWIRAAHKCRVRELIIETNTSSSTNFPMRLPRSLYTCCRMLVALNLSNGELVDDVSSLASFPSLKKLSLISMKFPGDEFVYSFLSSCPVLEDLVVKRDCIDGVTTFSIIVPSLKSLVLHKSYDVDTFVAGAYGIVIDAPSLELLDVFDDTDSFPVLKSDMPKVVDAKVVISCDHPEQIMGSITSVKHLRLCVKDAYPVGTLFYCLVSLNICTCEIEWLNLLMHVLRDSPNLQALKFEKCREPECDEPRQCWIEPSTVPKCLLTNLETMEWVKYKGTEEEIEVVAFILGNGSCLKKVTIHPKSTSDHKKLKMSKELSFLPRRSPTCRLSFD